MTSPTPVRRLVASTRRNAASGILRLGSAALRLGRHSTTRRVAKYAALTCLLLVVTATVSIDRSLNRRLAERLSAFPSLVYATPHVIRPGRLDAAELLERLHSLGYEEVGHQPEEPGQFRRDGNDWEIYIRSHITPDGEQQGLPVSLGVRWGKLRRIRHLPTGKELDRVTLEPQQILAFYGERHEKRRWIDLQEVPRHLQLAVQAVEDRRFPSHMGVDPFGIARALAANLQAGTVVQGGSTITQQLVKNLYGPGKRTLRRKLVEAVGAVLLEFRQDKDAILEAYLNEIYLGQQGPVAVSGMGEAAHFYFGEDVRDLELAQSAVLAGIIQSPGRHHPRRHPDRAKARRDLVLKMMHDQGHIDAESLALARSEPLGVLPLQPVRGTAGHGSSGRPKVHAQSGRLAWVEDFMASEMETLKPGTVPSSAGFSVFTTIDPRLQQAARVALEEGLTRLERDGIGSNEHDVKDSPALLEGAVVVMRPEDGAILALVGGRDYGRSQFNRATRARRPAGSTFKPFVYLAGFERSLSEDDFSLTPAAVLEDSPLHMQTPQGMWSPANYDGKFRGPVSARRALEESINVPTVRAAQQVGLPAVVEMAARLGIESPLQPFPSLALGAQEVTPLELATAYCALANGGDRVVPYATQAIVGRDGTSGLRISAAPERVLRPELAYLITHLLEGVLQRGTANSARRLGFDGHAAGKTGSSDGLRDAWFVGYTPEVLALVWVGFDDNRTIGRSGAGAALPIWVDLMARIHAESNEPFPRPKGIIQKKVDPATGLLASARCPDTTREIFVRGMEPTEPCDLHGGKRRSFWNRLFD